MDIDILVNKDNTLCKGYIPKDLIELEILPDGTTQRVCRILNDNFLHLKSAAKAFGFNIEIFSGYRSFERQETLLKYFEEKIGIEEARRRVALPGTSEHQTGLAIDVCAIRDGKDDNINEEEAKWLEDNAHNFGFILRYPKEKEDITGFQYEPWHFRYVGVELAKYLRDNNITLEEYHQMKRK